MSIAFRDLKAQYRSLQKDIDEAVLSVLSSGQFIGGAPVNTLEQELADYVGVKECITCGNGTDALSLAMAAYGIGEGDAVFVPDFTFFASAEVIAEAGATPVFVDIDPDTYNISAESLKQAVSMMIEEGKLTPKAVVAVDLFGLPADYPAIQKIANAYGLFVIEDSAQGFGGSINGQRAGSFGDIATTSFFPAKPLGCYGDGGAIFTNDSEKASLIRSLKVHGKGDSKYDNVRIGRNSRLDTVQAAILLVKFHALRDEEQEKANRFASYYTERLKDRVITPMIPEGYTSAWAQYTIRFTSMQERDAAKDRLQQKGIPSMIYYPKAMHDMAAFQGGNSRKVETKQTSLCIETVLSIPFHPYLNEETMDEVVRVLCEN